MAVEPPSHGPQEGTDMALPCLDSQIKQVVLFLNCGKTRDFTFTISTTLSARFRAPNGFTRLYHDRGRPPPGPLTLQNRTSVPIGH